jgi:Ca2+-transporting ATPase
MYGDNLLVRKLDAPEKMGSIEEILCGKTGTITTADMKVSQFICQQAIPTSSSEFKNNTRKDTLLNCKLSDTTIELIKQSIMYNCEARVEMDATTYVPVGNSTEVAFLKFLQDAEIPVHLLIQRKLGRIRAASPFSPEKKRSAVAIESPEHDNDVYIYVKGAPEEIISLCDHHIIEDGETDFSIDDQGLLLEQIKTMATTPLRVISFAYTKMSLEDWKQGYEG